MSLRPRFAGDGLLRLPVEMGLEPPSAERPIISGRFGDDTYDPFERVPSGLLLAEEFARLDLTPREGLSGWFERHGVLDLARTLPTEVRDADHPPMAGWFWDRLRDIEAQRANVAWHLASIARLSDHLVPQPGEAAGVAWDERWARPLISIGDGHLWLGGEGWARHLRPGMEATAEPPGPPPAQLDEDDWRAWWRAGHSVWQQVHAEGVPIVRAVAELPALPEPMGAMFLEMVGSDLVMDIGTGPWGLVELQRRLMDPYITRAGQHRVEVGWPEEGWDGPTHPPLVIHERRTWDSTLAPIHVQLLEGLRRVTEGLRGGAFCKECGQPFLTLDARRSAFCTDRERYRHGQREFRRRQKVITIQETPDDDRLEQEAEQHIREHPPGMEEPEA